jgi:ATP-dependent DNA helicase PIF1
MLPAVVMVEVSQYKGPLFLTNKTKLVPICPITKTWYSGGTLCSRTMLPMVPAYAISIHKSQGMSLDKVLINLSTSEFATGLSYTAISRCKKFKT